MAPRSAAFLRQRKLDEDLAECAMANRHRDMASLIEEGANIEYRDRAGYTPLSEAASAGHTIACGVLLRALADPNTRAEDGRSPLHRAAFQNWLPVVRLLLDNGADPDAKDLDGATPWDLAKSGAMKELFEGCDREQNREVAKEKQKAREKLLKPVAVEEFEDSVEEGKIEEEIQGKEDAAQAAKFEPPVRVLTKAEKATQAKAAREKARADRERRYQDALAEMASIVEQAGDSQHLSTANAPVPLTARVRVCGAGEKRLNGTYHVEYAAKERIEFQKEDDPQCMIIWAELHDEWRMSIGDFKLGTTLFRHKYRPNVKADAHLGIPCEGWQAWFGKGALPTIKHLAEDDEDEDEDMEEDEAPISPVRSESERQPNSPSQKGEYIELQSNLKIVKDANSDRGGSVMGGLAKAGDFEVNLTGGERLIETEDGLFSAGEVPESAKMVQAVAEIDPMDLAAAWLERAGSAAEVPTTWTAIQAAKTAAQGLFAEGKLQDACQTTTAAIRAAKTLLRMVEDPQDDDEIPLGGRLPSGEEVEGILGVLHSNRSLLLLQQIQAGEAAVLAHGPEAAWNLVARDADKALASDANNFKASYRRARAFFELGELDQALLDANRVVDHYAKNSSTPNPEAAALRDRILEAVQKERRKWGERGPARWNRGGAALIAEIDSSAVEVQASKEKLRKEPIKIFERSDGAKTRTTVLSAPRSGGEIEKVLLSTLKGKPAEQVAYVKEHLSSDIVRRFFRRTPLGPDLLAVLMRNLADLTAEDKGKAEQLLAAVADAPSSKTQADMFDQEERSHFQRLLKAVSASAAAPWLPAEDSD